MLCDKCQKRVSKVLYTKLYEDRVEEIHLCEICAAKQMKEDFALRELRDLNLEELIEDYEEDLDIANCPKCDMSRSLFLQNKRLGCPHCYKVFANDIKEYFKNNNLENKHRGKFPKDFDKEIILDKEISNLKEKLDVSIQLEEYEQAAQLRDRIKNLEEKL